MLENSLLESGNRESTRKPATVFASTIIHGLIVAALILVPLLHPQAVPILSTDYLVPLPSMPKPIAPVELLPAPPRVQLQLHADPGVLTAPCPDTGRHRESRRHSRDYAPSVRVRSGCRRPFHSPAVHRQGLPSPHHPRRHRLRPLRYPGPPRAPYGLEAALNRRI